MALAEKGEEGSLRFGFFVRPFVLWATGCSEPSWVEGANCRNGNSSRGSDKIYCDGCKVQQRRPNSNSNTEGRRMDRQGVRGRIPFLLNKHLGEGGTIKGTRHSVVVYLKHITELSKSLSPAIV